MQESEAVRGISVTPVTALRYNLGHANDSRYESTGLLCSMIPMGSRVLDIGCGSGSISKFISAKKNSVVLGIEPNLERAKMAQENGIKVIAAKFSTDLISEYGKFDVIIFADVLEHIVDPIELLEKIKPALNQNGIVLASIPNVAHWTVRLRLMFGNFDYKPTGIMDATHLRWFTRKGVRHLFDTAGYNIEHFHGAAGSWINAYRFTPLRFVSDNIRGLILSKFCSVAPGLISVQHVVSARLR